MKKKYFFVFSFIYKNERKSLSKEDILERFRKPEINKGNLSNLLSVSPLVFNHHLNAKTVYANRDLKPTKYSEGMVRENQYFFINPFAGGTDNPARIAKIRELEDFVHYDH